MDNAHYFAVIVAAFVLAGFVKGVIGLGLPTVAIGVLGLIMTPAQAAAILIVPSFITNVWQCVIGGGLLALLRRMWPMLAGICIGTYFGALYLPNANSKEATVGLGLALVLYAVLGLFKVHFSVPARSETWLGLLIGTATGAVTALTGVYAVPSLPYLQAMQFERDKLVQAMGLSFTTSTVTLALALAHAGEMRSSLVGPTLVALGAALFSMVLGQFVRGRVKAETFRLYFFLGLLALGAHLALRGLL